MPTPTLFDWIFDKVIGTVRVITYNWLRFIVLTQIQNGLLITLEFSSALGAPSSTEAWALTYLKWNISSWTTGRTVSWAGCVKSATIQPRWSTSPECRSATVDQSREIHSKLSYNKLDVCLFISNGTSSICIDGK